VNSEKNVLIGENVLIERICVNQDRLYDRAAKCVFWEKNELIKPKLCWPIWVRQLAT